MLRFTTPQGGVLNIKPEAVIGFAERGSGTLLYLTGGHDVIAKEDRATVAAAMNRYVDTPGPSGDDVTS